MNNPILLLVSGATVTVRACADSPALGHLLTPANGNRLETILATGLPFAIDNAAFSGFDGDAYHALVLEIIKWWKTNPDQRSRLKFIVAPDVVADADETARQFVRWWGLLRWLNEIGMPIAYVLQDGCDPRTREQGRTKAGGIPWEIISCLFVGGSTDYKMSAAAASVIRQAKASGLWVHVGRVNSYQRLQYFESLGVDSFDGGQFSMFPNTYIPKYLERLESGRQIGLFESEIAQ
jgi:hypothetical protein